MAWVIARMWASVNDPRKGDPRCPLVPKLTRWAGSSRSGRHSKYSRSRRARSTSISFGASLPARGEIAIRVVLLWHRARFGVPNLRGVLGDRAVARKFPGAGDIQNGLARPFAGVRIELAQPLIRVEIGSEIRQMHVVIAMRKQRIMNGTKNSGLIAAKVIGRDYVQCGPSFGIVGVMPMRAVPAAAIGDLLCAEAEQKEILLAGFFRHFYGCAVAGADRQCAVHHEFHVAGAAGLVAGGREIGRAHV